MAVAESYAPQGRSGVLTWVMSLSEGDLDFGGEQKRDRDLGLWG